MTNNAILLVGPTGSGKTPLGDYLTEKSLNNIKFAHFDFGEHLRNAASKSSIKGLTSKDIEYIKEVLSAGALLENETFYIAGTLLDNFIEKNARSGEVIILNGLPRHTGQAENILKKVNIKAVISLECTPQTVLERIGKNSGGDRTSRVDDELTLVKKKLETFSKRTAPLIEFFSSKNAKIIKLKVESSTQPDALSEIIAKELEQL
ncbi:MAG: nucleoside monophosphate kinase [Deltaproteobacteria bacterium]|nr:nucleoside monophosphate kinase [Deltaproteobacteria bacterium]